MASSDTKLGLWKREIERQAAEIRRGKGGVMAKAPSRKWMEEAAQIEDEVGSSSVGGLAVDLNLAGNGWAIATRWDWRNVDPPPELIPTTLGPADRDEMGTAQAIYTCRRCGRPFAAEIADKRITYGNAIRMAYNRLRDEEGHKTAVHACTPRMIGVGDFAGFTFTPTGGEGPSDG